jgi:hypothetical protein
MSHVFSRAQHAPSEVAPKELAGDVHQRVATQPEYAAFTSVETGVDAYPAEITLSGLDKVLGTRITRLFLQADAESTLHMGAKVLADHSKTAKTKKAKDLQTNLMINIIKEVAETTTDQSTDRYSAADDLIRRCSLEPDFKSKLRQTLYDKATLNSSFLTVLEHD